MTDRGAATVHRWSDDGATDLGQWGSGRDNIRGIHVDFGRVWLANFGAGGAAVGANDCTSNANSTDGPPTSNFTDGLQPDS